LDINLYAKQLSTVKIDKDNFNQDNDKVTMIGKIYGLQYPILTNQWKYGVQQHTEWNISVLINKCHIVYQDCRYNLIYNGVFRKIAYVSAIHSESKDEIVQSKVRHSKDYIMLYIILVALNVCL